MLASRLALAWVPLAVAACSADPNYVPVRAPVASIRLVPQNDTLPFGGAVTLLADPLDADGHHTIPDSTPIWVSLVPSVVTVDGVGHVQAIWFGAAAVRVRIDRIEATADLFVRDPPIDTVWISPRLATIAVGDTIRFTAWARNAARLPAPTTGIQWISSDATRLVVDSTGLATGVAAGSAVVRALLAGYADSAAVNVNPPPPSPPSRVRPRG